MKFEKWRKKNESKRYVDILSEAMAFEDDIKFREWAERQRLNEFHADWAMLAISNLSDRLKAIETGKVGVDDPTDTVS